MCGIVAVVSGATDTDVTALLLEGLQRLEYRGYDSAGLAVAGSHGGPIREVKVAGRVADLRAAVGTSTPATTGIAHTRWATHGAPTAANAHPHLDTSGRFAVVHNGIIENAEELRAKLVADGVEFRSETDTEVIAHLVARAVNAGVDSLELAVRQTLDQVEGTYGLVVLDRDHADQLVVARNGSPVAIGLGDDATFVASDVAAFVRHTQRVIYLDDGEIVTVTATGFGATTTAPAADRTTTVASRDDGGYELDGYDSFMRKEIHDQPRALRRVITGRLDERFATARFGGIDLDARELRAFRRVKILGCGSAYYAGQQGAVAIEEIARIPADAEPAAEFRYRNPVVDPDTLYLAVSQSGETVDTLMAVQELQRKGATVLGMVNVVGSAIARETGRGIFIHAGPEFSVASTKALTNMTASFAMVGLLLGRVRDLSPAQGARLVEGFQALPDAIEAVVAQEDAIAALAPSYASARSMYFIGRHRGFPVAREGAQKLKEISYIHAEAYQASELKHGPLALVDADMPSVVIVPDDDLLAKNLATIEQIRSRGGRVLAITNRDLPEGLADHVITVPAVEPELDPIVLTVPLQILACHIARLLQRDVDKPRNLAKSVTVE
ncbi:glutamine--fructose-6-phosphate transaminase (isomerizing) [Jatrophihabitans sp. YIM 134969]